MYRYVFYANFYTFAGLVFIILWGKKRPFLEKKNMVEVKRETCFQTSNILDHLQVYKLVHLLPLCLVLCLVSYGLDEAQAGIKIAGRNSNNLRYADDNPIWQKVKKN